MGIDTSIYQHLLRPPKSVAEYNNEAMQGEQNKLAMMMNQAKMDEYTRGVESERAEAAAFKGAIGANGKTDRNKLYSSLAQSGHGAKVSKLQKGYADQDKAERENAKAEIEMHLQRFELIEREMRGVQDQASYDAMRQRAMSNPLLAESAAGMPAAYDPAAIKINMDKALPLKEKLAAQHQEITRDLAERKFGYEQTNDAANRGVQIRGQNVAASTAAAGRAQSERASLRNDERARDFNGTRTEENRIKREQKDDVANMTKASQVASFDTMLGTLDRLSKHGGLSKSVGIAGKFPTMPGSQSANFQAELDTFQSQAFIPMVSQLKGMGALSDAEGRKLTAAVGALNPNMGEAAFRDSIARITTDMDAAKRRVTGTKAAPAKPASAIPGGWSVKEN